MKKKILAAISIIPAMILALGLLTSSGCTRTNSDEPGQPVTPKKQAQPERQDLCENVDMGQAKISAPMQPGEKPVDGDILVKRLRAEPGTLNPLIATDAFSGQVNMFIYDSLVDRDMETMEFRPWLAKSWEVSEDKLSFTFHLRDDVKWHDGEPFTADDVIYSFRAMMDPAVDAASLRLYYVSCESVEKIDDYTVRFTWKEPYFLAFEWSGGLTILPKHILDDGTDFNKHPYGRHPIGTGPYKFVEWKTGTSVKLIKNENYWREGLHFNEIHFKIITDDNVGLQALKQGQIDLFDHLKPMQWIKQTNSRDFMQKFNKLYYDYPSYRYIGWNMRHKPFDDKNVRLAMTKLLNRDAIIKNIMHCLAKPISGSSYINTIFYDQSIKPWPYDPEGAKELLTQAGFADHDSDGWLDRDGKPFAFEFLIPADITDYEQIATIFQEDLKKAGIQMSIRKLEWAVFLQNIHEWKFNACMLGWALGASQDPYQLWHSTQADQQNSSNHVGFKNEEVDKLIELGRKEFDDKKRALLYHRVHRILHEEQPYTFLFIPKELTAVDKRFHNVIPYAVRPIFDYSEWFVPLELQKYKPAAATP